MLSHRFFVIVAMLDHVGSSFWIWLDLKVFDDGNLLVHLLWTSSMLNNFF